MNNVFDPPIQEAHKQIQLLEQLVHELQALQALGLYILHVELTTATTLTLTATYDLDTFNANRELLESAGWMLETRSCLKVSTLPDCNSTIIVFRKNGYLLFYRMGSQAFGIAFEREMAWDWSAIQIPA